MEDDVAELISDTMVAVTVLRVKHDKLKSDLRKLVGDFSWIPGEYERGTTAYKLWIELNKLLEGE